MLLTAAKTGFICAVLMHGQILASSSPAAELLVVSEGSGEVLRYDAASGAFLGEFPSPSGARGIATDGNAIYIAGASSIASYTQDGEFVASVASSGSPQSAAVGSDQRVFLTDFFADTIWRADFSVSPPALIPFIFEELALDGPTGITVASDGWFYVSSRINGLVLGFDPMVFNGIYRERIPVGGNGPQGLTFGSDGNLYVASDDTDTVIRFDGETWLVEGTFAVLGPNIQDGVTPVFGPDGNLYVSDPVGDAILRFDGTTGAYIDDFVPIGLGRLDRPTQIVFAPEPRQTLGTAIGALLLLASRTPRNSTWEPRSTAA